MKIFNYPFRCLSRNVKLSRKNIFTTEQRKYCGFRNTGHFPIIEREIALHSQSFLSFEVLMLINCAGSVGLEIVGQAQLKVNNILPQKY